MSSDSLRQKREDADGGFDQAAAAAGCGDDLPSATDALRRAKAELKKAQDFYEEIRRRATERVEAVRKTTVGELLDGTLGLVKKHPGPSLLAVAAAGFCLGRLLKR